MVITSKTVLPTEEELTVPEVELSTCYLKAASFYLGKTCEAANNVSGRWLVIAKNNQLVAATPYILL